MFAVYTCSDQCGVWIMIFIVDMLDGFTDDVLYEIDVAVLNWKKQIWRAKFWFDFDLIGNIELLKEFFE